MRRTSILLIASLFLCSCVGVESRLVLRADGSGSLDLTYKVSQLIQDLGRSGTDKPIIPLPVTREDFERGLSGVPGVELRGFTRSENENDITIRAQISFDKIESLAKIAAFQDAPPEITVSGSTHSFSELIVKASAQDVSPDTLEMMDAFFSGYSVSLTVEVPSPIQSYAVGTLSADKKTLTFSAPVKDLVTAKRDVIFSLSW